MKQVSFYHDAAYCSGCLTCVMACRDYYNLPKGLYRRRVLEKESGCFTADETALINDVKVVYHSVSCRHCSEPPCVAACATGALSKRERDGLVVADGSLCNGCRNCLPHCPHQALQFNGETSKIDKCDGCLELIEKNEKPVCVMACPLRVLEFVIREKPNKPV